MSETEKKVKAALKAKAAATKVEVTPQKLAKILKRAKGAESNK